MNKKLVLLFAVSIFFLILMLFWIGIDKIISSILLINFEVVVLLFFLQIFIIFLYAFKLFVVVYENLSFFSFRSFRSFKNMLFVTMVGLLANNITPVGAAGGEPFKAYVLHKIERLSMEKSFAAVIANLFIEVLPIFIFTSIALFFVFKNDFPLYFIFVLTIAGVIVLFLFLISFFSLVNKTFSMKIAMFFINFFSHFSFFRKASKKAKERVFMIVSDFNMAFKSYLTKKILFFGTVLSLLIWIFSFLRFYLIFISMGYHINVAVFLVVQVTLIIISFLPLLPGSILIWEASSIGLFILFGVPKEIAAAATVIDRFFSFWLTSFFGVVASLTVADKIEKEKSY